MARGSSLFILICALIFVYAEKHDWTERTNPPNPHYGIAGKHFFLILLAGIEGMLHCCQYPITSSRKNCSRNLCDHNYSATLLTQRCEKKKSYFALFVFWAQWEFFILLSVLKINAKFAPVKLEIPCFCNQEIAFKMRPLHQNPSVSGWRNYTA